MRKIDTSAVTVTNAMPFKSGILEHLQYAYQETIAELGKSLFGNSYDATKVYILNGLINSGSSSDFIISAGSVFFNGEIFLVDAVEVLTSGSNVVVGKIVTSYYSGIQADPVEFRDGVDRNIHQIRKFVLSADLSGSGSSDYASMINLAYKPQGGIGQTIEWKIPSGQLTDYFDNNGTGIHALTSGWILDDQGVFVAGYKAGDTDFGTIDNTIRGGKNVTLTLANIPPHTHNIGVAQNGSGPTAYISTNGATGENTSYATKSAGGTTGAAQPFAVLPPYITKLKITRIY